MNPVEFSEQNVVFAKDQPQYLQLPACRLDDGRVIFCWDLSWCERLVLLFTGRMWHQVLTFNHPLQPQKLSVAKPVLADGTYVE